MSKVRKIIHIDMDAFYASVEQRDHPQYRGKPIIVGGRPDSRGVVATCSYEARQYGIHSAMAASKAYRLCPHAIFARPRFDVYKAVSQQIRAIFYSITPLVEPLSLDEAYLDVSENLLNNPSATRLAQYILSQIYTITGLTASAGVSYNKFLAKVASDYHKPHGLTVITPQEAMPFIEQLPIKKFFGVGRVTSQRMINLGIKTGADLKKLSKERLVELFGKAGVYYYQIVRGVDNRPVNPDHIRKSLGKETTLDEDVDDLPTMIQVLQALANEIEQLLKRHNIKGKTVTLKVKYDDFTSITRSKTVAKAIDSADLMMNEVKELMQKTEAGVRKVRLLGIAISSLINHDDIENDYFQLEFQFDWPEDDA